MEKVERIIQKLQQGDTVSKIAREERINRYPVSMVKQTMEIYETKLAKEKKEKHQLLSHLEKEREKLKREKVYSFAYGVIAGSIGMLLLIFLVFVLTYLNS